MGHCTELITQTGGGAARVLDNAHHLEQRRATDIAHRLHLLHHLFKRHILVLVGG